MSQLLGIDVAEAPRLIDSLRLWSSRSDDALATVRQAETLSELLVGVDDQLDQLRTDGLQMSAVVNQALADLTNHQLVLTGLAAGVLGPELTALRVRGLGGADGAAQGGRTSGAGALSATQIDRLTHASGDLDELVAEIAERDGSGRGTVNQAMALHELLKRALGPDVDPSAAFSMLLNGLPADELSEVLGDGVNAALAEIASAMELGLSPSAAGLHASLFPAKYAEWHQAQARIDGIDSQLNVLSDMSEQAFALQQERLDLVLKRGALVVDTLDRSASSDAEGALRTFDAIGAAAATLTQLPGDFVGESYAALWFVFSEAELTRMAEFLTSDTPAALSFATTLGPAAMSTLLDDMLFTTLIDASSATVTELVENLRHSLALASHHLPRVFAAEMIEASPTGLATFGVHLPPELLFSERHAEQFLVEGAAASLRVHAPRRATDAGDARVSVLENVANVGLGAELAIRLAEQGSLDALLFADSPLSATATWRSTPHEPGTPPGSLWTLIVGQSAANSEASAAIIQASASSKNALDRTQARVLSAILARQVPNYVDMPATSSYFELARRVFATGEGRELDAAVRLHLVNEAKAGFESGEEYWWDNTHAATFAGNVDFQKYLALQDFAIEQANAELDSSGSLGDFFTGLSIAHGVAPLLVAPAPSVATAYAVTGVAISAAPWLLPIGSVPQLVHEFYEAQLLQSYSTVDRGQAIALLAALTSGAVKPQWGTTVQVEETVAGPTVVVTRPDGGVALIDPIEIGDGWVEAVIDALPPETQIQPGGNESARLRDALGYLGTAIFSDGYSTAMQAGLERQGEG